MEKLTVLLGAGFSRNAGYPSGFELNRIFETDIEYKLYKQSSGEWLYDENRNSETILSTLNEDNVRIPFLLKSLINDFKEKNKNIFDYESFYDWLSEVYTDMDLLKTHIIKVNQRITTQYKDVYNPEFLFKEYDIDKHLFVKVSDCFNYAICDILAREYNRVESVNKYTPFINYLKEFNDVEIFTLNHDLLLEYLLKYFEIKFSDGFTIENSCIVGDEKAIQEMYKNSYEANSFKLYKLHGSIDYYQFEIYDKQGIIYNRTGRFHMYKPKTYFDKHYARMIDVESGKILQEMSLDIIPKFLTGRNLKKKFLELFFYSNHIEHFKKSIDCCNQLLIIGYSYSDLHINGIIKITSNKTLNILNINPTKKFELDMNLPHFTVNNIDSIDSIN